MTFQPIRQAERRQTLAELAEHEVHGALIFPSAQNRVLNPPSDIR